MSLIKCIECGKTFSEFAEACPECGCPIEKIKQVKEENKNIAEQLPDTITCPVCRNVKPKQIWLQNGLKCNVCDYSLSESIDNWEERFKNGELAEKEIEHHSTPDQQSQPAPSNLPTCPTCGSTNVQKISGLSRAAHGYMFGLFSKTAKSQFCCKNCGYKF